MISDSNNGIPESGETIGLSIPIKNFGSQSVSGVYVVISSSSNYVSIINETVSYGTIQTNERISNCVQLTELYVDRGCMVHTSVFKRIFG